MLWNVGVPEAHQHTCEANQQPSKQWCRGACCNARYAAHGCNRVSPTWLRRAEAGK